MAFYSRELVYGLVAAVIILALIWIVASRKRSRKGPTPLQRKKLSLQKQSCSYCKQKVSPKELTFYAGPVHGKVVGVCRKCKPQAERQSLARL
ncbi:hypothetical protein ACFQI7_24380 [Paenibacillus allorhizosphaerae]|uniref:HNH endonuclease n=1 Tax=Paenibacillus allorhizosphaerae TaxID=2849866 RepID=A0ABN7TME6_9BACL|nr:hypothetical protein [Paenibacillus allorhizosphaerae]CAG7646968.1 hypothetical protein PAECIP111802_03876 [Paenibacillus allorhizosphaerae]